MLNMLRYAKAIAALVGTIVTVLLGTYTGDTTVGLVLTIISVVATAVATYVIPNYGQTPVGYAKTVVALIGAVASALLAVFAADTEVGRVLTTLAALATALVTYQVPNAGDLPPFTREPSNTNDPYMA